MTDRELRAWRGVKPVAAPVGVAISTRVRTTSQDDQVLERVAEHLGRLRRADLAVVSRPGPVDAALNADERRQVRRDRLNTRKKGLTALRRRGGLMRSSPPMMIGSAWPVMPSTVMWRGYGRRSPPSRRV
ncbi:hypothetical protein MSM1_03795 [Mycobacterium sp. SM1]|uniref:hypothetical protein n=1 Tax=Mycobacterium sp. SM1 TaxID=2816243 RepID=UPI001BCF5ED9|nr:hypothetical protein [Mycobacterium sp. SM1]MBS4727515.1 hypothetical protein [Mycobacterium sp. SM1]